MGKSNFMPKNCYYEDVKIIKRPIKAKLKVIFLSFGMVFLLGFTIFCSVFLSRALTIGNITTAIVYGGKEINIGKHQMYLVSLGKYDNYVDAEKVALGAMVQGAGGFVWDLDNSFCVIGNVYGSIDDASAVKKNLSSSNYDVETIEVSFPKINLVFDSLENKDVSTIKKAIEFVDECYDSLYDYSIKFDKGEMNNFAICSGISSMRGECKVHISAIQSLMSEKNDDLQQIINCLTKIDEILNLSILKTIDNSSTNYSLKNSIISIVYEKYTLYRNF